MKIALQFQELTSIVSTCTINLRMKLLNYHLFQLNHFLGIHFFFSKEFSLLLKAHHLHKQIGLEFAIEES